MEEYDPWFDRFHEKYPDVPIGISEYGCEALNWHNSGPKEGDYSEEYQAVYRVKGMGANHKPSQQYNERQEDTFIGLFKVMLFRYT